MFRSASAFLSLILIVAACRPATCELPLTAESQQTKRKRLAPDHRADQSSPHLPNLLRVTKQIYTGGEPKGSKGFEELARLGIRTVVSVDGAIPNIELAKANQLRYVHIPIGYDEVSKVEGKMFAALVRREPGPFYIHCHHGKHRGPVAAAIAHVASGEADNDKALEILTTAGTSKKYAGLWKSVREYQPPPDDECLPELVEIAKLDSFAAAMAEVDRQYDYLKLCQSAGWQSPPTAPDLTPAQQALLLKESFRELRRMLERNGDDRFRNWMSESEKLASQLQRDLTTNAKLGAMDETLKILGEQCQRCHSAWRN